MDQPLRIVAAEDDPGALHALAETLRALGHQVDAEARSGRQLIERCQAVRPDLIVTDISMPDLDGIAAVGEVSRERPTPAVLVSGYHDRELQERARQECIMAYLVKPVGANDLAPAISLARWRFELFQGVRQEAADLRQALEDRKVIERAKGVLMKCAGVDEPQAYRRLQELASTTNRKMREVAQMILIVGEAFRGPAPQ